MPPSARRKTPSCRWCALVKAPFSCPKSSDSIQRLGMAPQLITRKGLSLPVAPAVDGAREETSPGARLPGDQRARPRRGDAPASSIAAWNAGLRPMSEPPSGSGWTASRSSAASGWCGGSALRGLRPRRARSRRRGLLQVAEGPEAHRLHRRLDRAVRVTTSTWVGRETFCAAVSTSEAGAVGHHRVGDARGRLPGRATRGRISVASSTPEAGHLVPRAPQEHVHHLSERGLSSTTRMRAEDPHRCALSLPNVSARP